MRDGRSMSFVEPGEKRGRLARGEGHRHALRAPKEEA
jgi:hypothetical protein